MKSGINNKILEFIKNNKLILIVLLFLFIERFMALYELGIMYTLGSDDASYVNSGIIFANTGEITMHRGAISAQIMPGMTFVIALFSLIFGEGKFLWLALKLLWISMGTITGWFIYKSVNIFAPKWCGIIATLPLFIPNFVWIDNLILTETPFIMFLSAMVYYTFKMGKENNYKNFFGCLISYMGALMLKANIAPFPVFALIYLLIVKYNKKLLIKQIVIVAFAILAFVVPWSIRNYIQFKAFIPLTYGSGNPTLLGTYEGIGCPKDEDLDYETNVYDVVKEKYSEFFDEDGNVDPKYERYISLRTDEIKAAYRQKVWFENDPKGMLYSYLILNPREMINAVYYRPVFNIETRFLEPIPYIEIILCIFSVILSIYFKKYRAQMFYLALLYIGNIYIYSTTFAFGRYSFSLVTIKYIAIGLGMALFIQFIYKAVKSVKCCNEIAFSDSNKKCDVE